MVSWEQRKFLKCIFSHKHTHPPPPYVLRMHAKMPLWLNLHKEAFSIQPNTDE